MAINRNVTLLLAVAAAGLLLTVVVVRRSRVRTQSESTEHSGPPAVKENWSVHTGVAYPAHADIWNTPAVGDDGTLYAVGSNDLLALRSDGALKWRYPKPGTALPPASVLLADDGSIWIGSSGGWVDRINSDAYGSAQAGGMGVTNHMALSASGTLLACGRLLSIPVSTTGYPKNPEIIRNSLGPLKSAAFGWNAAFTIDDRGNLTSWSLDFQRQNWSLKLGYGCHHPAVAKDNTIYAACPGEMVAVNPSGSRYWSFPSASTVSPAAIAEDGSVLFGGADGSVYRLEPDGTVRWKFAIGKPVLSTPAISSSGVIYVGSSDGNLYALDALGHALWVMKTNAEVYSPTIAPDGTVYVQSGDGMLHAIAQPQNGGLAGQWPKLDSDMRNTARTQ